MVSYQPSDKTFHLLVTTYNRRISEKYPIYKQETRCALKNYSNASTIMRTLQSNIWTLCFIISEGRVPTPKNIR